MGSLWCPCVCSAAQLVCPTHCPGCMRQPAFSPRSLQMWNTTTNTSLCTLPFDSVILSVRLNTKRYDTVRHTSSNGSLINLASTRLVVVLQKQISIFDLNTMGVLQSLETPHNPTGPWRCSVVPRCRCLSTTDSHTNPSVGRSGGVVSSH